MALATPATVTDKAMQSPELNVYVDTLSFPGDTSYPTGGTTDFQDFVRAAVGHNVEVLSVLEAGSDTGGTPAAFIARYDKANDTLLILDEALAEVAATTDLSTTTFNLVVISK
jgi:hypothetical protein